MDGHLDAVTETTAVAVVVVATVSQRRYSLEADRPNRCLVAAVQVAAVVAIASTAFATMAT